MARRREQLPEDYTVADTLLHAARRPITVREAAAIGKAVRYCLSVGYLRDAGSTLALTSVGRELVVAALAGDLKAFARLDRASQRRVISAAWRAEARKVMVRAGEAPQTGTSMLAPS